MADDKHWDDEDYEPTHLKTDIDKWDDEDEETPAVDDWEQLDNEEDKSKEESVKAEVPVTSKKSKKTLAQKIAEREEREAKEREQMARERQDIENVLTLEERQKLVEESDFELTKSMLGVNVTNEKSKEEDGLSAMNPSSKEEFDEFEKALVNKICQFENNSYYSTFLESLFRNLSLNLESDVIKKLGSSLNILGNEKSKQDKSKGKKKKVGVKLKQDTKEFYTNDDTYDDYNDFI